MLFFVLWFINKNQLQKQKIKASQKCIIHLEPQFDSLKKNLTVLRLFFSQAPKQWMLDKLRGRWVGGAQKTL